MCVGPPTRRQAGQAATTLLCRKSTGVLLTRSRGAHQGLSKALAQCRGVVVVHGAVVHDVRRPAQVALVHHAVDAVPGRRWGGDGWCRGGRVEHRAGGRAADWDAGACDPLSPPAHHPGRFDIGAGPGWAWPLSRVEGDVAEEEGHQVAPPGGCGAGGWRGQQRKVAVHPCVRQHMQRLHHHACKFTVEAGSAGKGRQSAPFCVFRRKQM